MPNEFPTSPEVLAEATAYALSELAIMSPKEMSPEAEMALITLLRERRVKYELALGVKAATPKAKGGRAAKSDGIVAATLAGGLAAAAEELF